MWLNPWSVVRRCLIVVESQLLRICREYWMLITTALSKPHFMQTSRLSKEHLNKKPSLQQPFILLKFWAGSDISFLWYWEESIDLWFRGLQFESCPVVGYIPNIAKAETLRIQLLIFSWTESRRILKGSNENSSVLHRMWKSVWMFGIVSIILAFIILHLNKITNLQGIVLNMFHLFSP